MALLRDYHAAIGEIIIKYNGTLERYAGDGVMVIFNDPVPVENPALQAVLMALEVRDAVRALTETWRRLGHEIGFGIGIAHGFATLGTIGFEGRFDYAAIGTVSNVASRLCDEAKPGQILISPRVLMKVEKAVTVEPVGEFALKGIRRPLAAISRTVSGVDHLLRSVHLVKKATRRGRTTWLLLRPQLESMIAEALIRDLMELRDCWRSRGHKPAIRCSGSCKVNGVLG
jgi:hypothetical protein